MGVSSKWKEKAAVVAAKVARKEARRSRRDESQRLSLQEASVQNHPRLLQPRRHPYAGPPQYSHSGPVQYVDADAVPGAGVVARLKGRYRLSLTLEVLNLCSDQLSCPSEASKHRVSIRRRHYLDLPELTGIVDCSPTQKWRVANSSCRNSPPYLGRVHKSKVPKSRLGGQRSRKRRSVLAYLDCSAGRGSNMPQ